MQQSCGESGVQRKLGAEDPLSAGRFSQGRYKWLVGNQLEGALGIIRAWEIGRGGEG